VVHGVGVGGIEPVPDRLDLEAAAQAHQRHDGQRRDPPHRAFWTPHRSAPQAAITAAAPRRPTIGRRAATGPAGTSDRAPPAADAGAGGSWGGKGGTGPVPPSPAAPP